MFHPGSLSSILSSSRNPLRPYRQRAEIEQITIAENLVIRLPPDPMGAAAELPEGSVQTADVGE